MAKFQPDQEVECLPNDSWVAYHSACKSQIGKVGKYRHEMEYPTGSGQRCADIGLEFLWPVDSLKLAATRAARARAAVASSKDTSGDANADEARFSFLFDIKDGEAMIVRGRQGLKALGVTKQITAEAKKMGIKL